MFFVVLRDNVQPPGQPVLSVKPVSYLQVGKAELEQWCPIGFWFFPVHGCPVYLICHSLGF